VNPTRDTLSGLVAVPWLVEIDAPCEFYITQFP